MAVMRQANEMGLDEKRKRSANQESCEGRGKRKDVSFLGKKIEEEEGKEDGHRESALPFAQQHQQQRKQVTQPWKKRKENIHMQHQDKCKYSGKQKFETRKLLAPKKSLAPPHKETLQKQIQPTNASKSCQLTHPPTHEPHKSSLPPLYPPQVAHQPHSSSFPSIYLPQAPHWPHQSSFPAFESAGASSYLSMENYPGFQASIHGQIENRSYKQSLRLASSQMLRSTGPNRASQSKNNVCYSHSQLPDLSKERLQGWTQSKLSDLRSDRAQKIKSYKEFKSHLSAEKPSSAVHLIWQPQSNLNPIPEQIPEELPYLLHSAEYPHPLHSPDHSNLLKCEEYFPASQSSLCKNPKNSSVYSRVDSDQLDPSFATDLASLPTNPIYLASHDHHSSQNKTHHNHQNYPQNNHNHNNLELYPSQKTKSAHFSGLSSINHQYPSTLRNHLSTKNQPLSSNDKPFFLSYNSSIPTSTNLPKTDSNQPLKTEIPSELTSSGCLPPTNQTKFRIPSPQEMIQDYEETLTGLKTEFQSDLLFESLKMERIYSSIPFYSTFLESKHPQLSPFKRALLIDWMMEVLTQFGSRRETFARSVNILDRYLALTWNLPLDQLQLVGASCMLIANKLEDNVYSAQELSLSTHCKYSVCDILNCQMDILAKVEWKINAPTLNLWMSAILVQWDLYLEEFGRNWTGLARSIEKLQLYFKRPDEKNYRTIMQYVDYMLLDIQSLKFNPSNLGFSILYLTLVTKFTPHQTETFHINSKSLLEGTSLNLCFEHFLMYCFELHLLDLLTTIQFTATFLSLPLTFELPPAVTLNKHHTFTFEEFSSLQTHNPKLLVSLRDRTRNLR